VKAFLLAAGRGTRLRPLTDSTPKCLLPIRGKPLLAIWLELLARHGVDEVLLNLHHLPEQVRAFLSRSELPLCVHQAYEPELLGSAGTLSAHCDFVAREEAFFICYADNLTDCDLTALWHHHLQRRPALTMGVFVPDDPHACGIAELSADGVVVGFEEKPMYPKGVFANSGIYVAGQDIFMLLDKRTPQDIGHDLIPRLLGRVEAITIGGYLRDIGTPSAYASAQEEWPYDR
jgi:mannose-1-phosphate guanylyltransferase